MIKCRCNSQEEFSRCANNCDRFDREGYDKGVELAEDNKLIALFDGLKFELVEDNDVLIMSSSRVARLSDSGFKTFLTDELRYNKSWDSLMPIWGKIGKLMYEIRQTISGEDYQQAGVITIHVLKAFQKVEIDSAFNWIVQAIKWYNLQKEKI